MSIEFSCPTCEKQYRVRDDLGGRRVACKECGEEIVIPRDSPILETQVPAGPYVDVTAAREAIAASMVPPRAPIGFAADEPGPLIGRAAYPPDLMSKVARVLFGAGPRRAAKGPEPDPMNTVGLFSLLLSFASYVFFALAAGVAVLMFWSGSPFIRPSQVPVFLFEYVIPGVPLSAFALLCCRLGRQAIVWPFAEWGLRLCAWLAVPSLPFVVWQTAMLVQALRSMGPTPAFPN